MDPLKRKKLENLLKMHERSECGILQVLDIINLNTHCDNFISKNHPNENAELVVLKANTKYLKNFIDIYDLADRYSPNYSNISRYCKIIDDISTHLAFFSSENDFRNIKLRKKNLKAKKNLEIQKSMIALIKSMTRKCDFLIHGSSLPCYVKKFIRNSKERAWIICTNDVEVFETQLRKFLRVCQFIQPKFSIQSSSDQQGWYQYLLLAKLLNLCCIIDLQESDIIQTLLTMLMKFHLVDQSFIFVSQPTYSSELFSYILYHTWKLKLHDLFNPPNCSNCLWQYCTNFSVVERVAYGDEEGLKVLMKYGFKLFSPNEQIYGHKYPDIAQVIPESHRIILKIMERVSSSIDEDLFMNSNQKRCFSKVMQEAGDHFITQKEMSESSSEEYRHLLSNNIAESECQERLDRNKELIRIYTINFPELALCDKPENIFKYTLSMQYGFKKDLLFPF